MKLEDLPNELLINIFEYLNGTDHLKCLYDLNYRINQIIFYNFPKSYFDFECLSKESFVKICNYIPSIIDKIVSLNLCGNDETSKLPELFLSNNLNINQFIKLEYLKLDSISSIKLLYKFLISCQSLEYLSTINISKCKRNKSNEDILLIKNIIFNLSKLKTCYFDRYLFNGNDFRQMKFLSSSIENLYLDNIQCDINDIINIFEHMINLRRISLNFHGYYNHPQIEKINLSKMILLKMSYDGTKDILIKFLKNFPNLICLIIKIEKIYLNGNEWENLLNNYLIKLKIFRFRMDFNLLLNNLNKQIDQLLNSFQNIFWIEQHQCFVRCQWTPSKIQSDVTLYSLPYLFEKIPLGKISKSTCFNEKDFSSYNRVNTLSYDVSTEEFFNDLYISQFYFPNLRHLTIHFPFKDNFWSIIPSLYRLNSLAVQLNDEFDYIVLQSLLDKALNLYSLTVKSKSFSPDLFYQLKSASIRRLDLNEISYLSSKSFSSKDCQLLVNSSIGYQSQVIYITIKNPNDIIYLIQKMIYIRRLTFTCENHFNSSKSTKENFIQWLQTQLPSTFSIYKDLHHSSRIHIWK